MAEDNGNGPQAADAPITGVVENIEDVELAVATKGEVPAEETAQEMPHRRRCFRSWTSSRRGRACGFCIFILTVVLAVCLPLLWPRDPSWKLTNLSLDEPVYKSYIDLFGLAFQNNLSNDATLPELKLWAEIELDNPNYLGGEMLVPGEFIVSYKGHDFGSGICKPAMVRARSTVSLTGNVSIRMWPQLFKDIITDILANGFMLTVHVRGGTTVRGPLGIVLSAGARCSVNAAVVKMNDNATRHEVVDSKECKYNFL